MFVYFCEMDCETHTYFKTLRVEQKSLAHSNKAELKRKIHQFCCVTLQKWHIRVFSLICCHANIYKRICFQMPLPAHTHEYKVYSKHSFLTTFWGLIFITFCAQLRRTNKSHLLTSALEICSMSGPGAVYWTTHPHNTVDTLNEKNCCCLSVLI